MIQIDDAGSGSFVGGTCIGVYRPETNEYYFDIIPVELYNAENFRHKHYLRHVVTIVQAAFQNMNVSKSETIEICRGYMFNHLKEWLNETGYCWYSTHITGRAQEIVEKNFEIYTMKLGLPEQYIKYTKYPFHFHKLLRWVFADYEKRIHLCKVGWKSWQKLVNVQLEESVETAGVSYLFCLKCGGYIKKGSRVRVITYKSNKKNYIYLHYDCKPALNGLRIQSRDSSGRGTLKS